MPLNSRFDFAEFFIVRSPLLSLKEGLGQLWRKSDRKRTLAEICHLLASPIVREALWISNPALVGDLPRGLRLTPQILESRFHDRIPTLYRYLVRMSSRCTPFGISAGISIGVTTRGEDQWEISPRGRWFKAARPDDALTYYACCLIRNSPGWKSQARFRANPTIVQFAERLCYLEETTLPSFLIVRREMAVQRTPALDATLQTASDWVSLDRITEALLRTKIDPNIPIADLKRDALTFASNLIDTQLLVSDLAPPITGADERESLTNRLRQIFEIPKAAELLDVSGLYAKTVSGSAPGKKLGIYPKLVKELKQITSEAGIQISPKHLIQVDLHKPSPNLKLSPSWIQQLNFALDFLARLKMSEINQDPHVVGLLDLRNRFIERYGSTAIPLGELFDPSIGLKWHSVTPSQRMTTEVESWLLKRMSIDPASTPQSEAPWVLRIEKNDVKEFPHNSEGQAIPEYFLISGSFVLGHRYHFQGMAGAEVMGSFLGRFIHGNPEIGEKLGRFIQEEERRQPNVIFADIVFLDQHRGVNYLHRPHLRNYEITLVARSGLSRDRQILLSDLTIGVRNGSFELRCPKLSNRRVIPRHGTAMNFRISHDPYFKLLGLLQNLDNPGPLVWNWGHLSYLPRHPRVECGKVILSLQTWRLPSSRLPDLKMPEVRRSLGIPRIVLMGEGDRSFPIDLANQISLQAAVESAKSEIVVLKEWLYSKSNSKGQLKGAEGTYCSEVQIPCRRQARTAFLNESAPDQSRCESSKRIIPPGREWMYLKVFINSDAMDPFLVNHVRWFFQEGISKRAVKKAFYVRYSTREDHLRLRLQAGDPELWKHWTENVLSWASNLLTQRTISHFSLEPYERELEKYGGPSGIELSEDLFTVDSMHSLAWLEAELACADFGSPLPPELQEWKSHERLLFALSGVDSILRCSGMDIEERMDWTGRFQKRTGSAAGISDGLKKALANLLRAKVPNLTSETVNLGSNLDLEFNTIRNQRDREWQIIFQDIKNLRDRDLFLTDWDEFLTNLCHLHYNRIRGHLTGQSFIITERELFGFLHRLYRREVHRIRT